MNNIAINDIANKDALGICSGSKLIGRVGFKLKDAEGNVVQEGKVPNNIVLGIRYPIIKLLGGWGTDSADLPFVRQLALGTGDTAVTIADEQLDSELSGSRKLTATVPTIADDGLSLTFSFLYDMVDDAVDNQDIKEMGLFTTDDTMIARTTVGLWRKTPGLYFEVYWTIGYQKQ